MSACWRSATRSPTAAASCSGESRCSPGRCGWRAGWDCRSRRTPSTARASPTCSTAQIPAFERRNAYGDARVRGRLPVHRGQRRARAGLGRRAFRGAFRARARLSCRERCDRVLTVTAPLDLGRPRAGAKVDELNARRGAGRAAGSERWWSTCGRSGRATYVMADRVHPTAFGQIAIAERALDVLERDGHAGRWCARRR